MTAKRLKVIVTRRLPDPVEIRLKELFDTELNETDVPFSDAQMIDAVKRADVLVPTVTDRIDGRLLAQPCTHALRRSSKEREARDPRPGERPTPTHRPTRPARGGRAVG